MINPEQLEVGVFVWWQASRDGTRTWGCLGRVEKVNREANKFGVFLLDDFSLCYFDIEQRSTSDIVLLAEMTVVDPNEIKPILVKLLKKIVHDLGEVERRKNNLNIGRSRVRDVLVGLNVVVID